jgi:hypothetical protein
MGGGAGAPGNPVAGNAGGGASPSTSPGIVVTPQTSYPITVGDGGFVTITWNSQ